MRHDLVGARLIERKHLIVGRGVRLGGAARDQLLGGSRFDRFRFIRFLRFGATCERALPAARFALRPERRSRNTLDAAFAALGEVLRCRGIVGLPD